MKSQWTECRGCFFCIARCEDCGGCLDFDELGEETVCSHLLCVKCWLDLPKCNICNRPYCKGHSNFLEGSSKFLGFVCEQCMESMSSSYHSTCGNFYHYFLIVSCLKLISFNIISLLLINMSYYVYFSRFYYHHLAAGQTTLYDPH